MVSTHSCITSLLLSLLCLYANTLQYSELKKRKKDRQTERKTERQKERNKERKHYEFDMTQ